MATEVAAVVARYIFRAEGQAQVSQAAENIRQRFAGVESAAQGVAAEMEALQGAQAALTASANTTSASVLQQRAVLQDLVSSYKEASAEVDRQVAALGDMGTSVETLGADLAALQSAWQNLQSAMSNNKTTSRALWQEIEKLYDAQKKLNPRTQAAEIEELNQTIEKHRASMAKLKDEYEAMGDESTNLENSIANLQAAEALLAGEGQVRTQALTGIQSKTKALNREIGTTAVVSKQAAGGLRATNGEIGRLVVGVATGRAGLYSFNEFFGRLILGMKNAIPTIAAVAAPIALFISGFKIASSATVQFGQALAAARPEIKGAYQDLQSLTNFDGAELLSFLEQATNRLTSFGAINATGTAQSIAELANIGQFRLPGAGDAGRVAQMIQRSVESVNFDPLRDLGFPVDELNAKLQKLADDGMTKAAQRGEILNEVARQLNQDVLNGEAAARANAEMNTMAGVMAEIKRVWDSIGENEKLVAAAQGFAQALREALPALVAIAGIAAEIGTILVKGATEFVNLLSDPGGFLRQNVRAALGTPEGQGIGESFFAGGLFGQADSSLGEGAFLGPLGLKLKGIDTETQKVKDSWKEWEDQYRTTEDAANTFETALKAVENIMAGFDGTADETANSLTRVQKAMQDAASRQGAFGLIDSVKALSQAMLDLESDVSTTNAVNSLQAYDRVLTQVIEKGPEQLELLRLQAERLFATGFYSEAEFAALQAGFDAIEGAVKPVEEEARRIRGRLNESTGETQTFTSELGNANSVAAAVGGTIGGWTGQINNATGAAVNFANVLGSISLANPLGMVSFGPTSGTGPGPGSPRTTGANFARQGRGGRGLSPADQAMLNSSKGSASASTGADLKNALGNVGDVFDLKARGGGGGGGGGGSAGASIEEIRQLFRNIGELIKIGTNNGVFFSTAGNAIPLGGKNEFLNTSGGSLIQTVNIRGIWDFADPAAKRQIMKELEEALANLKKETK